MKNIIIVILILGSTIITVNAQESKAENPKKITAEIEVDGKCGMCKTRIEEALDMKGVKFASWNVDTKMAKIIYNSEKVSMDEIKKKAASIGHDTDLYKASDHDYNNLHGCCKYRKE